MKGLIIVGSILLFLFLISLLPVKGRLTSYDVLTLRAGLGPISFRILPKKQKKPPRTSKFSQKKYLKLKEKEEERKSSKKRKKKKEKTPEPKQKKSLSERIDEIKELLSLLIKTADKYSKKILIDLHEFKVTVSSDDAMDTAIRYGAISQSVAYLLEFLDAKTTFSAPSDSVSVDADFVGGKSQMKVDLSLGIRLINVFRIAFFVLINFFKIKSKSKS